MDVNIIFLEKLRRNVILSADRPDIADSCLCRLLHDIAQLTCQLELTLAGHHVNLDFQRISAHTRPCKSAHDSDLIGLAAHILAVFFLAEILLEIAHRHIDRAAFSLVDLARRLARNLPDPAL